MLPADQLELITAAVDGELSAAEARAFQKLLESSEEARAVYSKLKNDSARVHRLPQAAPPADLKAKILARIASATPAPRPKPTRTPQKQPVAQPVHPRRTPAPTAAPERRVPAWVPVALAASLLLAVTAGSFAFFNNQISAKNQTAKNPWVNSLPAPQEGPAAIPSGNAGTHHEQVRPDPSAVVKSDVSPVPPLPMPKVVPPTAIVIAPEPRPITPDFLTSPVLPKIPPFDLIQIRTPFLRTIAELDREDMRQEFLDELTHDRGAPYRIDLFVRDTARGVDVFQNAAKSTGLTVFADAATLDKLKKKQAHAVVIYTEALSPAELTALFAKVASEDAKFSPRVCDSVHALPVAASDATELRNILGLDVGLFKRVTGSGGTGQGGDRGEKGDKPVSAGTIDAVTKALTSPPAKPGEKPAVLMTWQAAPGTARTVPAMSAELKQYLSKRGDRKPGVVPAIIVIRPVG